MGSSTVAARMVRHSAAIAVGVLAAVPALIASATSANAQVAMPAAGSPHVSATEPHAIVAYGRRQMITLVGGGFSDKTVVTFAWGERAFEIPRERTWYSNPERIEVLAGVFPADGTWSVGVHNPGGQVSAPYRLHVVGLVDAIVAGDHALLRYMIEQGLDVNEVDASGWTPVLHAARAGEPAMVEALIEAGANAAYRAPNRATLADVAAVAVRRPDSEAPQPGSVSTPAAVRAEDPHATAAYLADLARIVEQAGQRAGLTVRLEPRPCIGSAAPGVTRRYCVHHDVASDVRRWGAELELRRRMLADALAHAFEGSSRLLQVTRLPTSDVGPWFSYALEYPEGLLDISVTSSGARVASVTLWPRDPAGSCLGGAASTIDAFELVGSFGQAEPGVVRTVLHCTTERAYADERGWTALFHAVAADDVNAVRALLAAGWHADGSSTDGWTPLLLAARDGTDPAIVVELLAAGANPRAAPYDAPQRDALWFARQNTHLMDSDAMVALIAAYLVRASSGLADPVEPVVLSEGSAPFLPPDAAPSSIEMLEFGGTVSLSGEATGTATSGPRSERTREQVSLDIDFELHAWTLPLVLDSRRHVVAVVYPFAFQATSVGDDDLVAELVRDMRDMVWLEIVDVDDGTYGATRYAFVDPIGDAGLSATFDLVPVRGLLVGAGVRAPGATRLGVGATVSLDAVDPFGGTVVTQVRRDVITHVGDDGHDVHTHESVMIPNLVEDARWHSVTTSAWQQSSVQTKVRPYQPQRLTMDGTVAAGMDMRLVIDDDRIDIEVTLAGTVTARGYALEWGALAPETKSAVRQRVVRLLLRHL